MNSLAVRTQLSLKNILLTTDLSKASRAAIPFANALAHHFDSKIYLLHVVPPVVYPEMPLNNNTEGFYGDHGTTYKTMSALMNEIERGTSKKELVLRGGFFWPVTQQVIDEDHIDLVVVGTHGSGGMTRLLIGSVAEQVYRHADRPVLTVGPNVKPSATGEFSRILFATNFESHSEHALQYALGLISEYDSQLIMVHVVGEPIGVPLDMPERLLSVAELRLRAMIPPRDAPDKAPLYVLASGSPSDEIVRIAKEQAADLIVMGAKRASSFATHMPFGVGHTIVADAPCPVLSIAF